jgi:hypothetical protein
MNKIVKTESGDFRVTMTPSELLLVGALLGPSTGHTGYELFHQISKVERRTNDKRNRPALDAAIKVVQNSDRGAVNTDHDAFTGWPRSKRKHSRKPL